MLTRPQIFYLTDQTSLCKTPKFHSEVINFPSSNHQTKHSKLALSLLTIRRVLRPLLISLFLGLVPSQEVWGRSRLRASGLKHVKSDSKCRSMLNLLESQPKKMPAAPDFYNELARASTVYFPLLRAGTRKSNLQTTTSKWSFVTSQNSKTRSINKMKISQRLVVMTARCLAHSVVRGHKIPQLCSSAVTGRGTTTMRWTSQWLASDRNLMSPCRFLKCKKSSTSKTSWYRASRKTSTKS